MYALVYICVPSKINCQSDLNNAYKHYMEEHTDTQFLLHPDVYTLFCKPMETSSCHVVFLPDANSLWTNNPYKIEQCTFVGHVNSGIHWKSICLEFSLQANAMGV